MTVDTRTASAMLWVVCLDLLWLVLIYLVNG